MAAPLTKMPSQSRCIAAVRFAADSAIGITLPEPMNQHQHHDVDDCCPHITSPPIVLFGSSSDTLLLCDPPVLPKSPSPRQRISSFSRSSSDPMLKLPSQTKLPAHKTRKIQLHGRKVFTDALAVTPSSCRPSQLPPPPPRGAHVSSISVPPTNEALFDHGLHARSSPLPLARHRPSQLMPSTSFRASGQPLERGVSFATIASEGTPTNHALQLPEDLWTCRNSLSRESPMTIQSCPSFSLASYAADVETTDDVQYGSMRNLVRPQLRSQATDLGLDGEPVKPGTGCEPRLTELAVVTLPSTSALPSGSSSPIPHDFARDTVANSEFAVMCVSVDWYSDRGLMRGFDDNATVFCITCETVVEGCNFKAEKRFGEFVKFKEELVDEGLIETTTPFPAKLPFRSLLGGLSDADKDERAEALEGWMNSVINQSIADTGADVYMLNGTRKALRNFLRPKLVEEKATHGSRVQARRSFAGLSFGGNAQSESARRVIPNQSARAGNSEESRHYAVLGDVYGELEAGHITQRNSW